jgi:hypothetical protein
VGCVLGGIGSETKVRDISLRPKSREFTKVDTKSERCDWQRADRFCRKAKSDPIEPAMTAFRGDGLVLFVRLLMEDIISSAHVHDG